MTTRKMKNFNEERFLLDLYKVDWDKIVDSNRNVNEAVNNLSILLKSMLTYER